jgi:hypothetical protein
LILELSPAFYSLSLSSGEKIEFAEIDVERIQDPQIITYVVSNDKCKSVSKISRSSMEAAKIGYDKELREALKSPPNAMLIKTMPKRCGLRTKCSSFDSYVCSLTYQKEKKSYFPDCFIFDSNDVIESFVMSEFTRMWKEGLHVIIVS